MLKRLSPIAILLVLSSTSAAQILDGSGNPNASFAGFYAWFDAGNGPNGGAVTPGGAVTTWIDATGQGHDLVRADVDVVRQPIYDPTSGAGNPAVEFDGDDYLWADNATEFGTMAGAKTIFIAARTDVADRGYIFDSSSIAGRNALFAGQFSAPGAWHIYAGNGQPAGGPQVALGVWQVHTCAFDGNLQQHFIDGTSVSSSTEITADLSGLVIGNRYTISLGHVGGIAEVLVYESALSPADQQAIEGFLRGKYAGGDIGTSYCQAVANSTGVPGVLSGSGSVLSIDNDVALSCMALPANSFGFFITSQMSGFVANPGGSQGNLCLAGAIGRYVGPGQIQQANSQGQVSLSIDLTMTPTPLGLVAVQAGETWYFSYWYRDANPTVTSNFCNGLQVDFQ